ncbi:MAG: PorT family protein [Myxococcota bacterium]|nr:PorT family protein [Myxococcota bacterium]
MKRALGLFVAVMAFAVAPATSAQEVTEQAEFGEGGPLSSLRFGVYFGLGMTGAAGDLDDVTEQFTRTLSYAGEQATPRFTAEIGLFAQYFFIDWLALDVGLGFLGKGYQVQPTHHREYMQKLTYMEIPLGVLIELKGFQLGVALALEFALAGKAKHERSDYTTEAKWSDREWDRYMRFNLAPKFMVGYAFPFELAFGTLYLIPGMDFSIHLIDEQQGDHLAIPNSIYPTSGATVVNDDDFSYRSWNLMFRLGVALQLN